MINFNDILNSVLSGLICSGVVAISTIIYKLTKKSYNKNKIIFWENFIFYFEILSITFCALFFRIDKISFSPFSFGDSENFFLFICLILNIIFTIINYKMDKKSIKNDH